MEDLLISIPAFLFAFGMIVFVHESGHFLAARLFGVQVKVFSLGFGKALLRWQRGGTDYRIAVVPLGGYVRMAGEHPEERSGNPSDFLSKPRWQRIVVYLAGPFMNLVLAVVLIAMVFMQGIEMQAIEEIPAVVGVVEEGSPSAEAGLLPGDLILRANGDDINLWKDLSFVIATSPERPVALTVSREGAIFDLEVTPLKVPRDGYGDAGIFPQIRLRFSQVFPDSPAEEAGFLPGDVVYRVDGREVTGFMDFINYVKERSDQPIVLTVLREGEEWEASVAPKERDGQVLIGVQLVSYRKLSLVEALVASVRFNFDIIDKNIEILGKLFSNEIAAKSALSGPIEIAAWAGQAAQRGMKYLIYMTGFLSISIGFMNLLPIPVLDGGHIAILLVECGLRRDLSLTTKERLVQFGFVVLMTLMAMVIVFDLSKNLPSLFSG
jgi:regulator of sigma E protease